MHLRKTIELNHTLLVYSEQSMHAKSRYIMLRFVTEAGQHFVCHQNHPISTSSSNRHNLHRQPPSLLIFKSHCQRKDP